MTFKDKAERQTGAAINAVLTSLSVATRRELDALRAEFEARVSALEPHVDETERATLLTALVDDLSREAASDAEQMAHAARLEAEQTTTARLAAAQAAIEVQLERERAESAALRETVDDLQTRLHELVTAAQADVAAAQLDVSNARNDAQRTADLLLAAEMRLQEADDTRGRLQQALDESHARLESEVRERAALGNALEAAREVTSAAHAEIEATRRELAEARTQVENSQRTIEHFIEPLDRVRNALRAFAALTQARRVLDTFAEHFGHEFDRSALFVPRGNRLEGWRSHGLEASTDVRKIAVPLAIESPVTNAFTEGAPITVEPDADRAKTGLLGHETYGALAVPVVVRQRVLAVAYAEWTHEVPEECRNFSQRIAAILADQAALALTRLGKPATRPAAKSGESNVRPIEAARASSQANAPAVPTLFPGPQRAAERVRVSKSFEVLVDGETALLVDISTLGAQVLCSRTMRPNRSVRLVLPQAEETVLCQGSVVWALFELGPSGGRYRAGLKFTVDDPTAIELFVNQQIAQLTRTA